MTYQPKEGEDARTRGGERVKILLVSGDKAFGRFGGQLYQWYLVDGHTIDLGDDRDLVGPWEEQAAPADPAPDVTEEITAEMIKTAAKDVYAAIGYAFVGEESLCNGKGEPIGQWAVAIKYAKSAIAAVYPLIHAKVEAELWGDRKFSRDERVTKISGSSWTGHVRGFYSTKLTPIGYAIESENEPNSVQIYPEAAVRAMKETDNG